ncbi:inositol polyphosphate 1-phosphatase [Novymonas esmeraldas]|uniref:3'(2'),5'-bisphosphate nucleotidase n=1 Tax=Novymonas esmeraldas TaxID=1808958 RepID=A0AAW0EVV2_9TRYP
MSSVNVAHVLAVCVRATLAAQRYVMLDLVRLPEAEAKMTHTSGTPLATSASAPRTVLDLTEADRAVLVDSLHRAVDVDVKAHLDYKDGDAANDLVTTADVLTQAVVMKALSRSFPSLPFTVVGEEDAPSSAVAAEAEACMTRHYDAIPTMPYEAELLAHVQAGVDANTRGDAAVVLHAESDAAMRRRLGIFIDPIDGTNCFVGGVWPAPMTLVGITLDSVPIAGVMNRVFYYPLTGGAAASTLPQPACVPSLSVVLHMPGLVAPFLVFDGDRVPTWVPPPECTPDTRLAVCRSSTTRAEFLQRLLTQLEPCDSVCARGAGYKLYHLLKKVLAGRHVAQEAITPADVFVCPPVTIKKWDCCAPHAFLHALGGDVFGQDGTPLRYPLVCPDEAAGTSAFDIAALPHGLVAVTAGATREVARRLGWTLVVQE